MATIAIVFEDTDLEEDAFSVTVEGDFGDDPDDRTMAQWVALACCQRIEGFIDMLTENSDLVEFEPEDDEQEALKEFYEGDDENTVPNEGE